MIRKIIQTNELKFSVNQETGELNIDFEGVEYSVPSQYVGLLLNFLDQEYENHKEFIRNREGGAMTKLRNKIWTCK